MNDYIDKEFCIEAWGDWACFTRPEMKIERVSYDVITPSAARAIFEAIFWKPAIRWQITRIEVLNPIKFTSIKRNEVGALASKNKSHIFIEEKRQQKSGLILKDVHYRLFGKLVYIPVSKRTRSSTKQDVLNDENPAKYNAIFQRRAENGQCFSQPYLGTREFSAYFKLITEPGNGALKTPINETKDFGFMLYDMDFTNSKDPQTLFYRPTMQNGIINVPSIDSEEVLK